MGMPTFRGQHNALKGKVYLLLAQEVYSDRWFTSQELHEILGVNMRSLRSALCKWVNWRRIRKRRRDFVYEYQLSASGKKWLETWGPFMPTDRYLAEIREWQAAISTKKTNRSHC